MWCLHFYCWWYLLISEISYQFMALKNCQYNCKLQNYARFINVLKRRMMINKNWYLDILRHKYTFMLQINSYSKFVMKLAFYFIRRSSLTCNKKNPNSILGFYLLGDKRLVTCVKYTNKKCFTTYIVYQYWAYISISDLLFLHVIEYTSFMSNIVCIII